MGSKEEKNDMEPGETPGGGNGGDPSPIIPAPGLNGEGLPGGSVINNPTGGGENESGQGGGGNNGTGKNGSDVSPVTVGVVGTVMLKPNADNMLECDNKQQPSTNKEGPETSDNGQEGTDSDSSDGILKGLQSDDSFHGMLPDEDIDKLLQSNGDYILHTVEKEAGKGRVIGITCLWNNKKEWVQVRAGKGEGVTFDMLTYKPTILELARYHVVEAAPIIITKSGQRVIPRRPVLREDWELRHDDVELLEKLGEGAFGEVRLGKLKQKNKGTINVAIKIIKGSVNKKAVEEAMKEARIMRKYSHPNVVRFYGVQAEVEPLMLLMEFVKGGSLDSYLKKNQESITVENKASMCHDAACGLEYLHLQDCIHRDIAARNCLMDVVHKRLKISDFGLSSIGAVQVLDPSKPAPIRWLSPEVIRTGCFAKPADVWSFGVLCWEIYMNAEVPYKEFTMGEVQKRIQDEGFRLRLPLTCQTEIRKLIQWTWTGDPLKRPTMTDCVQALKPFYVDKKKSAQSDPGAPKKKKHRKHKKKKTSSSKPRKQQQQEEEKVSSGGADSGAGRKNKGGGKSHSRISHMASMQKGSGQPKKRSKQSKKEVDDDGKQSKVKYKNVKAMKKKTSGESKKTSLKPRPKNSASGARKAESPDDSDTDKEAAKGGSGGSMKSSNQPHKASSKSRSTFAKSPPSADSKAGKKMSQQKKSKAIKKGAANRISGSDEDNNNNRKNRKGSDEENNTNKKQSKDSTLKKKKGKTRRKS